MTFTADLLLEARALQYGYVIKLDSNAPKAMGRFEIRNTIDTLVMCNFQTQDDAFEHAIALGKAARELNAKDNS